MRKRYWFLGMRFVAILALFALSTTIARAQLGAKFLPTLSLQKELPTNNPGGDVVNGDTIYVSEPGNGEKRYLVMPIFIHNCLDSLTSENIVGNPGERIFSFRFQLQYNNCMLKAVGVSKKGALPNDTNVLAKHFNMSMSTATEPNYKFPTTGGSSTFGERVTISGSSSLPLPRSPVSTPGIRNPTCSDRDYTPFVYIVFEIVGTANGGVCGITADQMILVRDSIRWNNYNPAHVTPEMIARGFGPVQTAVFPPPIFPITYPNDYGSAVVQITRRPRIDLIPSSQVVQPSPSDNANYELVFPLQTQFGNPNRVFRGLKISNGVAGTFLRNLTVETDQPWLRIDLNDPGTPPGVQQGGQNGERGVQIRNVGVEAFFNIVANPTMLPAPPNGYPTPGIYEGYVTIRSVDAQNSSVRLRVVLIVNRNPLESGLNTGEEPTQTRGIQLRLRSSATTPDFTYLTMGTGIGATDGVDSLFGELEGASPPPAGSFYARFFPPSLTGFNGLIDGRGIYTEPTRVPRSTNNEASIDIRNFDIETIHTYCVNFDVNNVNDYPVVLEYDLNDLPQGAQLFFKQNVAGVDQTLNMRLEGANIGGTRRAIFIADPSVKSFCIDYLLPRVVQFPEINRGWNFISLPVEPSDPRQLSVFPNSNSGPIRFTQNVYSKEDEVHTGIGYFVKYSDILDNTVSGVPVLLIHEILTPYRVRLFQGWNTVGALSVPTTVDGIAFGPFESNPIPSLDGEVYRYVTSRGYEQTSRIEPGYGYWIKVTGTGWYRLEPTEPIRKGVAGEPTKPYQSLNNLTIADNGQHANSQLWFGYGNVENKQYEMPPVPGVDLFDVRFNNNGFVSATSERNGEHVVELTGVTYPVVLSVENVDAAYVVTDAETGAYIGEFAAGEAGTVRITNSLTKSVKLTRVPSSTVNLSEAYPNPASDRMSFDIAVPTERHVTVGLYNSLGEKVADLFDGTVAGQESVDFSGKGLSTGVYVYKMTTSNGETEIRHVVSAR
ncbi:MAG: T9SS type A sorting domain-containing protein [Candidatus Kapaibacterium sp.]